jgi:cytochrome c biogenesis protein
MLKFLSSVKLAVILIAAIVIASIYATLNPQINVYGSIVFKGLLVAFTFNLFLCTSLTAPTAFKKLTKVPLNLEKVFKGDAIDLDDTNCCEERLKDFFEKKKYKVKQEKINDKLVFLAQKGLANLIAPHLLHIGLIIVFIGAYFSSFGTQGQIMGFIGDMVDVPSEISENMAIKVNDFQTLYDEQGAVDNWVTELAVFIDGKEVAVGTTRVNHPFKYKGVVFYQSAYGYSHIIEASGTEEGFYAVPDGKMINVGNNAFNIRMFEDKILLKAYENNEVIYGNYISPGDVQQLPNGLTIKYLELYPYSVLLVKNDPGTTVVMIGFIIIIIASMMFWTGRYREIHCGINLKERKLSILINCKNKDLRREVKKELLNTLGEEC